MKKQRQSKNCTKDIRLPNEEIKELLAESYYQKVIDNADRLDVDMNHLEKLFTDKSYYLAMKIVPLLERKVLYLSYVEHLRLNDICKRLKLPKNKIISLRNKAIVHFKNNLVIIQKSKVIKNGGKNDE